jgi:hypothetical protein
MPASSFTALIDRLRASDRPFAGHTAESLQRKLASSSLRPEVRDQVTRELQWRERNELS